MKLNIELNIDYLDEEYNLDDAIKQDIIDTVAQTFKQSINISVERKIKKRISNLMDDWIMKQLHLFCDKKIRITDKWGDTQEHHDSVTDMFKTKFDEFFNASVDDKGKTLQSCSYGSRTTRIDKMLNDKADEYMKDLMKNLDRDISRAITSAMENKIKTEVKERVIRLMEQE